MPHRGATATGGTPIAYEYWLTLRQAIVICQLSRAPRADDAKLELAAMGEALFKGQLIPTSELPVLSGAIRDLLQPTIEKVERIDDNVIHLSNALTRIESRIDDSIPRRDFPKDILRQYQSTIRRSPLYIGKCACGCGTQILDENGNLLKNCNADHWYGPQRIGPNDGWYVDENCNLLMRNSEYRNKRIHRYEIFHEERRKLFPSDRFRTPIIKKSRTQSSASQLTMKFE
jgi:hypothetical protein